MLIHDVAEQRGEFPVVDEGVDDDPGLEGLEDALDRIDAGQRLDDVVGLARLRLDLNDDRVAGPQFRSVDVDGEPLDHSVFPESIDAVRNGGRRETDRFGDLRVRSACVVEEELEYLRVRLVDFHCISQNALEEYQFGAGYGKGL
ncbi:hypothetical protein [Halomicrobium urmianum]|uniref:hypothetical protein n=1 Tax=Halomicrobium urmianum TaxID=1586233 RepID=UPI0021E68BA8|nr:hypothetical protein [Halomicrobium urmianum]